MIPIETLDPISIEKEIQKQIATVSATATRASLFNLIIFKQAFKPSPADQALEYLLGKRPGRIILIEAGFSGPSQVHISARCHPNLKNVEVCFQEIHIQSGEDGMGRDPGFWSPLIIREIPVYIWWLEPLLPLPELLHQVDELADRLLIHSGYNEGLGEDPLKILRSLATRGPDGYPADLADFSWYRILPLRRSSARIFDLEATRAMLPDIERVSLKGGSEAEALLYFLWLASCLGWQSGTSLGPARGPVSGRQDFRLRFRDAGGKEVSLEQQQKSPLEEGYEIVFHIRDDQEVSISCGKGGYLCLSRPHMETQPLRAQLPGAGQILLREVDLVGPDSFYHRVLERARGLTAV